PGAPAGAAIDPATGAFSWTPTEAQGPGSYPITVRVNDSGTPALSDSETFTVTEVNARPVLASLADRKVAAGALLKVTATATDPDTPANALAYALVGA